MSKRCAVCIYGDADCDDHVACVYDAQVQPVSKVMQPVSLEIQPVNGDTSSDV